MTVRLEGNHDSDISGGADGVSVQVSTRGTKLEANCKTEVEGLSRGVKIGRKKDGLLILT